MARKDLFRWAERAFRSVPVPISEGDDVVFVQSCRLNDPWRNEVIVQRDDLVLALASYRGCDMISASPERKAGPLSEGIDGIGLISLHDTPS